MPANFFGTSSPKSIIDESSNYFDTYRSKTPMLPDFGVWVKVKQELPAFSILLYSSVSLQ
jgi:hypothetical protein